MRTLCRDERCSVYERMRRRRQRRLTTATLPAVDSTNTTTNSESTASSGSTDQTQPAVTALTIAPDFPVPIMQGGDIESAFPTEVTVIQRTLDRG